jgi:uncharacterized Zn-finger protein
LKFDDENSRIRIHWSEAWIRESGSTPTCHGSGTLTRRCGKTFATKLDLERHERFKHYACGRHRFTCAACLRVFASRLGLANHERAVHIGLPHTCSHLGCDKRFLSERDLRDHENCHTRARSFLCPDCGDTFLSSKQMANHRERHKVI